MPVPRISTPGASESHCFFIILIPFSYQLAFKNLPKQRSKTDPKATKINQNWCQEAIHLGLQFLIDFLAIFDANFDPKNLKIHLKLICFSTLFQNRPFEVGIDFWSDFGTNMSPFSFQKSNKIGEKMELGKHRIFDRFLHGFFIDFPLIWYANLELSWFLRRAQDATKTAPKMKCATFFAPAAIFRSTSPPLGVIRARIGKIWGSVLEVSGAHAFTIFKRFSHIFPTRLTQGF